MRYRYRSENELKDSGVEWIGKIPKGWNIIRGKFLFDNKKIKNSGAMNNVLSLTLNGVIDRDINNFEGLQPESFDGYQEFKEDNLVFKLIDLENISTSRVGLVHRDGLMSPAYIRLEKKKDINMKYYYYNYFDYYKKNIFNFLGSVGVRSALNSSDLLEMEVLNLQEQEQEKIANFLDEKTSQFDLIISKKEELIERLEEAKKSLISEVITGKVKIIKTDGGYELIKRSSEEMKDSGVDWMGNMPNDWEKTKLKYVTHKIIDGAHHTPTYVDEGIPFLRVTDITKLKLGEEIDLDKVNFIPEEEHKELIKRCKPEKGDLLLSKNGTIGITKVIDWDYEFSIFVSLCLIKPIQDRLYNKFCDYFFKSDLVTEQISNSGKTSTITNLHLEKIKEFLLFLPPLEVQKLIVEYLDTCIYKMENLISKVEEEIELLKQAKQSLISEVVTGKIEILD